MIDMLDYRDINNNVVDLLHLYTHPFGLKLDNLPKKIHTGTLSHRHETRVMEENLLYNNFDILISWIAARM